MHENIFEKFLDFIHWYTIKRIFEEWVYPGYFLKNLLFYRHDKIKIPQVKPYEYSDISYLMLCANMELIVKFIEKELPDKHICWYTDKETGEELGHKYGESPFYPILFPEYKDKWVMDIIKEIYHFWKVDYPNYLEDEKYLLFFWHEYFCELKGLWEDEVKLATSMEDFAKDTNWEILSKYLDKDKLFEEDYVLYKHRDLEIHIENLCQKYLHLCIEIRQYLWT
jgi:hypothetical protein